MKDEAYALMGRLERDHWWYRSLRRAVARELGGRERILDVGCGTGGMADHLKDKNVCGLDLSPLALEIAAGKGVATLVRGDCTKLPFAAGSFDAALCLDLLYHEWVGDEAKVLEEINRILRSKGRLIIQLPAFGRYLRNHDRSVMGQRRYTSGELENLLLKSGFAIEKLGYRNFPALCFVEISRYIDCLRGGTGLSPTSGTLNELLGLIMSAEEKITFRMPLPLGLSVWGVARKP